MQILATFATLASFLFQSHAWAWSNQKSNQIRKIHSLAQDFPPIFSSSLPACKRRQVLKKIVATTSVVLTTSQQVTTPLTSAAEIEKLTPESRINAETGNSLQNFVYRNDWVGTSLPLISPLQAAEWTSPSYNMGRWPDTILRRPASGIDVLNFGNDNIRSVASKLRRTARENGAVGLAAQQCGIDISMIFLDDPTRIRRQKASKQRSDDDEGGMFLVNPRIISRSPEVEMRVWKEECLVLPPSFTATVLRDNMVTVQYETLTGETKDALLQGEKARCLQHELDHDRGILITDHVGLDDLESREMREIEMEGHDNRMFMAYSRFISEPSNDGKSRTSVAREIFVKPANAYEAIEFPGAYDGGAGNARGTDTHNNEPPVSTCDDTCKEERKRRIEERRAMMKQSRSSTSRSDVLELSKQRAKLYGSEYQGASCPPGFPCI